MLRSLCDPDELKHDFPLESCFLSNENIYLQVNWIELNW